MKNKIFKNPVLKCDAMQIATRMCVLEGEPAGYKSVSMFPEVKGEPTKEELKEKDKSLENPETPNGRNAIRAQSIMYLRKYQSDKEHRNILDVLDDLIQKSVRAEVGTPEPNTTPPEVADKVAAAKELKTHLDTVIRAAYVESDADKKTLKLEPLTIPEDPSFPEGRNKIRDAAQKALNESKVNDSNKANLAQLRSLLKLSYYAETGELWRISDKADAMKKLAKDQGKTDDEQNEAAANVWIETYGKDTVYPQHNGRPDYPKTEKDSINQTISTALLAKLDEIAPNRNDKPATPAAQPAATPAKPEAAAATTPATPAEDRLETGIDRDNFRSKVQRWLNKYKYEAETAELRDLLAQSMRAENKIPEKDQKEPQEPKVVTATRKEKFDAAALAQKDEKGKETAPTALTLNNPNAANDAEGRNFIRQKAIDWLSKNQNHTEAANVRLMLHNSQRSDNNGQLVALNEKGQEVPSLDGEGKPVMANIENITVGLREKLVELGVK